jgi:hypothetical protein
MQTQQMKIVRLEAATSVMAKDAVMWRKLLSDEFRDRAIDWLDRFGFIAFASLLVAGIVLLVVR